MKPLGMFPRFALRPATVLAVLAFAGLAAFAACDGPQAAPLEAIAGTDGSLQHASHGKGASLGREVSVWLAELRATTAPFHRLDAARAAGWNEQITGCLELPGTGGMGYHYGNIGLIDGTPEALAPELLVYAPQRNGRLQLVAVEYIVPFDAWTDVDPPSLHGIDFHRNEDFGLWVLHAWIWKHNPTGIFMDWNPTVSCPGA
ncbi:MAG TPA: hypothetical protein VML95_10815 [Longimicrobiales bacterium]|nr:hypothetical protein [Longimicrobiales bacterium]